MPPISINHGRRKYGLQPLSHIVPCKSYRVQWERCPVPGATTFCIYALMFTTAIPSGPFSFTTSSRKATNILLGTRPVSLKLTRKRMTFSHWSTCEWRATLDGPYSEFVKLTGLWWCRFGSEKPSVSSSLHVGVWGTTAQLSRCYIT